MGPKKQFIAEINCLLREGKTEQAIAQINESQYCADVDALKLLGNAYIRVDDYDAAYEIFRHLTTLDLNKEDKKWVVFNFAIILRLKNKLDGAISILKKLLKESPEEPLYSNEMGRCYFDKKENDIAEQYFRRALENVERIGDCNNQAQMYNQAEVNSDAAWFFKETGKPEIAIKLLKRALTCKPIDKDYLMILADCYCEINDNKTAKEIYKKVKNYYPDDYRVQDYVTQQLEFIGE